MPTREQLQTEKARRRLIDFTLYTYPGYLAGWFHREVCAALDEFLAQVLARQSPRLMIFAPPRHGKSEIVSRRFPAFAMGRAPDLNFIGTSYAADLASMMNRDVQRVITSPAYREVFPDTRLWDSNVRTVADGSYLRNSDAFEVVGHRGIYQSAGVGGGITGKGADIGQIDDPVKDAEQANSAVYRQKVWDWYTSTFYPRLGPGGGVLLVMTRWNQDDLAGRLLSAQEAGGDVWKVVSYPAIAEAEETHRRPGQALHGERYSLAQLQAIKRTVGSRVWEALYQQRPSPAGGGIFKAEWWKFWRREDEPEVPSLAGRTVILPKSFERRVLSWDMAFKKTDGSDRVCGGDWGINGPKCYLLGLQWDRMSFVESVDRVVKQATQAHGYTALLIEDKANGPAVINTLESRGELYGVVAVDPAGGKEARAQATSPRVEAGDIFIPLHAPWRDDYIDEHGSFPNSAHDDAVDQQSQLLNWLISSTPGSYEGLPVVVGRWGRR